MHWFKVAVEVWLVCGVLNLIAGIIWTNRASKQALQENNQAYSSRRAELGTASFINAA